MADTIPDFSGPDFSGNACAGLSPEDCAALWRAACILADARGLLARVTSSIGRAVEQGGGKAFELAARAFGEGWQERIRGLAEDALRRAHDLATIGLDPDGERAPWLWFNKAVISATGAVGGFFGLPGMAVDIPLSTLVIMRSVAEIARAEGEDIASDDARRACLEVMSLGGPDAEDDDIQLSYWATRAALAHATLDGALRIAAARFGVVLSEKMLAQVVPAIGAVAGGGLNYLFMDYYQQMARVHFTVRRIERAHGGEGAVRACFDRLLEQARRRPGGRGGTP